MAYRNPLAWNRNMRPGLFKTCSQDTPLPQPELGLQIGLCDGSLGGFDWLGEENNTGFTYSDMELDRMVAELNEKGYGDMGYGIGTEDVSYEMPQMRINIGVWRSHSR